MSVTMGVNSQASIALLAMIAKAPGYEKKRG